MIRRILIYLIDWRGILGLAALGYGGYKLIKSLGKNKSNLSGFTLPEFFEDPYYKESQGFLSGLGKDILGGEFGAFSSIGKTGSKEFEDLLSLTTRDITQRATEAAAKSGRARGGALPSAVSRSVADASTQLRFSDFLRANEGLKFLFGQGRAITEGVRGAGLTNQAQRNSFNLDRAGLDVNFRSALDQQDLQVGALQGEAISNVLNSLAGAAIGGATGGPAGAVMGALGGAGNLPSEVLDKIFGGSKSTQVEEDIEGLGDIEPYKPLKFPVFNPGY